jgi:hypothetical protein
MTDVRRADPSARRRAVLFVAVAIVVGTLLIVALERYRGPLRHWLLAEPATSAERISLMLLLVAALLLTPLLGFAAYLWSLGGRILRAKEFPPPGLHVIRDTRVITGEAAVSRGRHLRMLAVGCGVASIALGFLLWRLASMFNDHAA